MNDVASIFRMYGEAYRRQHPLPLHILKVMSAIEQCRTAALGGHVDECDHCGHLRISYNSCRNRHCPKCQSLAKEKWLLERKKDLLPVPYFHVVFTIPSELNQLVLRNQKEMYNLLFKASSETLIELGKDPKHLGAEIGFISILHTWGQNLMDHPHIHCIVPGGGLSVDKKRWINSKSDFFIHIKVLSQVFKGKFLDYLKRAYGKGSLKFHGEIKLLEKRKVFQRLIDDLYHKDWVVYSKAPFKGPEQVLEYLGRYTHRVAISNNRIMKVRDGKVTFRWKDYQDGNQQKLMSLDADEFIRRFLMHILPNNFVKIRHYGLLSNRNRKTKLQICKELLHVKTEQEEDSVGDWKELLLKITGVDVSICPCCKKGNMIPKETLYPERCGPPEDIIKAA